MCAECCAVPKPLKTLQDTEHKAWLVAYMTKVWGCCMHTKWSKLCTSARSLRSFGSDLP